MAGCDEAQLTDAEDQLGVRLPPSMRSLYRAADGRFRSDGQWWVVWPLDRLVAENVRAWDDGTLTDSLIAFGDDGTGDPFCVRASDGAHVARWSLIDNEVVETMTFGEFESDWLIA